MDQNGPKTLEIKRLFLQKKETEFEIFYNNY